MNNYGEILESGGLRFERLLPGPIERVWSWIADGDKREHWLSGGGTATHAGQKIDFTFQHQNLTPHDETYPEKYKEIEDGIEYQVEVIACEAPVYMAWYWPAEDGMNVKIEITLKPEGDQVRLILVQHGDVSADHLIGSSAGWHVHLGIMIDKLSGETPKPFWREHEAKCAEYEARFKEVLKGM